MNSHIFFLFDWKAIKGFFVVRGVNDPIHVNFPPLFYFYCTLVQLDDQSKRETNRSIGIYNNNLLKFMSFYSIKMQPNSILWYN